MRQPNDISLLIRVTVCAARLYNSDLFHRLLDGWIDNGRLTGSWADDSAAFTALWGVLACKSDVATAKASGTALPGTAYAAYRKLQGAAIARSALVVGGA
jgi:hypothetical protein